MAIQHANRGIITDGLVHYYDPKSLKSYRGQGGYNLLNPLAARCEGSATSYWANTAITSSVDYEGLKCFKITTAQGGYLYSGTYYATGIVIGQQNPYRMFSTGSYSLSCKVWAPAGRILSYGFRYYPQGEESTLKLTGSGNWQTIKRENLTLTQVSNLSIQIRGLTNDGLSVTTTPDLIPSFTFYVAEPMVNSGSYSFPYFEPSTYSITTTNITGAYSDGSVYTSFTKASVGASWTNSRIYSNIGFADSVYMGFRAGQTDKFFMMGLNTDPNTGINWSNLDYAIYCKSDSTFEIRESNSSAIGITGSATTAYTTSSVFEIKYDGSNITYWKDNDIVRTVPRSIGNSLYMDSSFYTDGAIVNSVLFSNGRSNFTSSGGYTDLSKISNESANINLLEFDSTGSKAVVTGSYVWFGGTNSILKNLTDDGNSYSLECWYMPNGATFLNQDAYFFGRQGYHSGFRQSSSGGGSVIRSAIVWYSNNTIVYVPSAGASITLELNKWYHLVYTVDGIDKVAKAYFTGSQWGSDVTLTLPFREYSTSPFFMYQASSNAYAANCRLGACRIYKKALSASEILQNFNAQKHLYGYS